MGFSPIWLHVEYFYLRDDYQLFVDIAKSNDAVVGELEAMYEKTTPEMVRKELRLPSNPSPTALEHGGLHNSHCLITYCEISKKSLCFRQSGYPVEVPLDTLTLEVGGIRCVVFSGGLQLLSLPHPCGDVHVPLKTLIASSSKLRFFENSPW